MRRGYEARRRRAVEVAGRWHRGWRTDACLVLGVALLAAGFRLVGLGSAYDVHIDEPFYYFMSRSVERTRLVPDNHGVPFLLHPPGFFLLVAVWLKAFGSPGDLFHHVFQVRYFQQVLAIISAVLIYFVGRRLGGRSVGILASTLFALDSFVLLQNCRVLLETAAFTFVLGGFLVLLGPACAAGRKGAAAAVAAGLLFGLAVFTKDMSALVTLVPLAAVLLLGWWLPRTRVLLVLAGLAAPSLVYAVSLVGQGLWPQFWRIKISGGSRLVGATISTGYTAEGAPSILSSAAARLSGYGVSYALMGVGLAAGCWLLIRRDRKGGPAFLGLLTVSAAALVLYGYVFGTVEEQFFYFLSVPAILAFSLLAVELLTGRRTKPASGNWPRVTVGALLALLVALDAASWLRLRLTPDNGQWRAINWMEQNAPPGSKVAWVAMQTGYLLRDSGFVPVPLGPPAQMVRGRVQHFVLLQSVVQHNYSSADKRHVQWYRTHSTPVFTYHGRSFGDVTIYRLDSRSPPTEER